MKAAVNVHYGPPEIISLKSIPKPIPSANEILIRVKYSSVNRTDCGFLRGKPFIARFFSGIIKLRYTSLGCEFSGIVESIGSNVTLFKKGDRVYGFDDAKFGGHAQYKTIAETKMVGKIPKNCSLELAGIGTEGSHYALSYVNTITKIGAKKVLVHGATGAIGSAAVQLLKYRGVYVVATSDTKNIKLVKSLGADVVIDREKQDFTQHNDTFDVVFDAVGKSSFTACKNLLKPGGIYIATELGYLAQNPLLALISPIYKLFRAKRVIFPIPLSSQKILLYISDRLEDGSFKPVLDRTYDLTEIVSAYKYVESGQKTGNVLIKVP